MSPKEMACVQAQIQPKSTTLNPQKHSHHLLRICFVLGSRLVTLPVTFSLPVPTQKVSWLFSR